MITVVKEFTFDAAHWLLDYSGDCANLHGHTYKLQIGVTAEAPTHNGMVIDFKDLKTIVKHYVKEMDHAVLNQGYEGFAPMKCVKKTFPDFPDQPTAENMVLWLQHRLDMEIKTHYNFTIWLSMVRLWETPTSYAEWRK